MNMMIFTYLLGVLLVATQVIILFNFKRWCLINNEQEITISSNSIHMICSTSNLSLHSLFQICASQNDIVELCSTKKSTIQELKILESVLEERIWRLVLKPGSWNECLIRWSETSWQHKASLKLAQHGEKVAKEKSSVEQVIGYDWGFNSGLNSIARAVLYAVNVDKPICVGFMRNLWAYHDVICDNFNSSVDCYFLRQHVCMYASHLQVRCGNGSNVDRINCIWNLGHVWDSVDGVNDTLAARGFAVDWFLRLKPSLWLIVSNLIRNINLPQHYIALHARYGDKFKETRPLDIDTYFYAACTTAHRLNIYDVYVATDSNLNLHKLIHTYKTSPEWKGTLWSCNGENIKWYYNIECHRHNVDGASEFIPINVKRYDAMVDILVDIHILRYATATLMTFSSNVGQISASLRMVDGNEKTISLDEHIYWPL